VFDGSGVGLIIYAGEGALKIFGEFEVGVSVEQLGAKKVDGGPLAGSFGPQIGCGVAKLVEGEERLLVGIDEPLDASGGTDHSPSRRARSEVARLVARSSLRRRSSSVWTGAVTASRAVT